MRAKDFIASHFEAQSNTKADGNSVYILKKRYTK